MPSIVNRPSIDFACDEDDSQKRERVLTGMEFVHRKEKR